MAGWILAIFSISGISVLFRRTLTVIRCRWNKSTYRHFMGLRLPRELALAKLYVLELPALLIMCLGGGLFGGLLGFGGSPARKPSTPPGSLERVRGWQRPSSEQNDRRILKKIAGALYLGSARRALLTKSQIWNAALIFVVLAIGGHWLGASPVFVFVCAALACIPLSFRLGQATECLGSRLGPVGGGLLNATFGNAAELIITVIALNHGLYTLVRTALIGSIIGQLLLVLGTSLLLAGFKYKEMRFSKPLVQTNFALMLIALVAIGLPTLHLMGGSEAPSEGGKLLAPALAVMLIVIYGFAVVFSLRSQPVEDDAGSGPAWSTRTAMIVLFAATGGIVFISELLVGSVTPFVDATGVSQVFVGLILIPIFSNVVDHMVAITVALKNKMDLSLVVSVGSAAQVACLVLPIVVLIGFVTGQATG